MELRLQKYNIASTLVGVVAQRLVRTICSACKRERTLADTETAVLGLPRSELEGGGPRALRVWEGDGCPRCRETGYYGRTGIFEVLEMNESLRKLIHARADAKTLFRAARMDGLVTLREAAVRKLAIGATTVEEVVAATGDLAE
jgi:general secretion pathway protein E